MPQDDNPSHLDRYPDDGDQLKADSAEMVTCPNCRRPVYEGSSHCPMCGAYIPWVEPRPRASLRRPFVLVGFILLTLAMVGWIVFG